MPYRRLESGDRVGNYLLKEEIGKGAFATVWKAVHHERPARVVAVKTVENAAFRKLLAREGGLPDIPSRHVIPILDSDSSSDPPYVVMPYYGQGNLAGLISRHPKGLPEERVESLLKDILAGLAEAHKLGIVHRDIKPANILLSDDGHAVIADFGLSLHDLVPQGMQSIQNSLSLAGGDATKLAGSLPYMAPEVLHGCVATPAADVYSVGLVLFEMLTGRLPSGLELPSQIRTNLRRGEFFDAIFYWACRPVSERHVDAALMNKAIQGQPDPIPWTVAKRKPVWPWVMLLFLMAFGFSYFTFEHEATHSVSRTFRSIGAALFLVGIPLLVAGLADGVCRLIKRRPISRSDFFVLFIPIILLLGAGSWSGKRFLNDLNAVAYQFNPQGCEYSVTFPAKPDFDIVGTEMRGAMVEMQQARMIFKEASQFIRAECIPMSATELQNVTRDQVLGTAQEYAKNNGLQFPEYSFKDSNVGKVTTVRGYKRLRDAGGKERHVTYLVAMYYGDRSVMILGVGAPSEDYPAPEGTRFLKSIKRTRTR